MSAPVLASVSSCSVRAEALSKSYGGYRAVESFDLEIAKGELVTLLGPSGCGKTTILRMIAGFVSPSSGRIFIAGRGVNDIPAHKRRVGLMFQSYALFPHMSVAANVAFGLRMRGVGKAEREARVLEALRRVRLDARIDAYPRQLSGGQQQRVALARALVTEPDILLLDEPFGALDRELRQHLQSEMKRLQRSLGISTLLVTHDQEEALLLSDRMAVMNSGRVDQIAAPEEIFERPATRFVADFMGGTNIFEGKVERTERGARFCLSGGDVAIELGSADRLAEGTRQAIMIRPEKIELLPLPETAGANRLSMTGVVSEVNYLGSYHEYYVSCGANGSPGMVVRCPSGIERKVAVAVGSRVKLRFGAGAVHAFPLD